MLLVEQHILKGQLAKEADLLCFKSKNLYNLALYHIRQHYLLTEKYQTMPELDKILQNAADYKALPAKVAQQVLLQLHRNFTSFFHAVQAYKLHPRDFLGRPKLPGYKDKQKGRNVVIYTSQAVSKRLLSKLHIAQLSKSNISLSTLKENIKQIRLVPLLSGGYVAEIVYEQEPKPVATLDKSKHLSIDLGLNNLVAMTSDQTGFQPLLVSGGTGKAINQWYNKKKAEMQSKLTNNQKTGKAISKLTTKRNRKLKHLFHQISKFVVATAVQWNIGTIVIGYNKDWKTKINIGSKNNQAFVGIPFQMLVDQVTYKAQLVGIQVVLQEESYTSKCSALDYESVEKHEEYLGKRVKRGLFRSASGKLVNADINGSCNILRKQLKTKGFQKAKADWIEAIVVAPKRRVFVA